MAQSPFSNMVLTFPDQGLKTKVIIDPSKPIMGSAAIFAGATAIKNGANIAQIGSTPPAAGQVLGALSATTLAWVNADLPFFSNIIYVNTAGSDLTGTGTAASPFATVSHAMSTITTGSPNNRFAIMVGPGDFTEPFSLKCNVTVIGTANSTFLSGDIDINNDTWFDPGGINAGQASFKDCVLIGTNLVFDYSAQQSGAGSLNFIQTAFVNTPIFTGFTGNNQNRLFSAIIIQSVTSTGCTDIWNSPVFLAGGTYTLNSSLTGNTQAIMIGGGVGALVVQYTAGPNTVGATLYGTVIIGAITVDGASASVQATADCITTAPIVLNGGTMTLLTPSLGVNYAPAVPANWVVQPTTVAEALDMLAAKVGPV